MTASTTYRFPVIRRSGRKTGRCGGCGKSASRSKTFLQTVNPWNRDKETGEPKTAQQIGSELDAELAAWKAEPVRHEGCEA